MAAELTLRVPEVALALRFYEEALGWERLEWKLAEPYALQRQVPGGSIVLLAGAGLGAAEQRRLQAEGARELAAGERFYVQAPEDSELETLQQRVLTAGGQYMEELEPGCWRTLVVTTPEGYEAAYWLELHPGEEEILELFASGPERLASALEGLDEAALDWSRAPGTWSIRQQVLHLVDLELVALHKLKFALASPERGRSFTGSSFRQEDWAVELRYAERPVAAEAALFGLLREHVLTQCRCIPDALQRSVMSSGREESAGRLMKMMAGHANLHIRRIGEIRAQHRDRPAAQGIQ